MTDKTKKTLTLALGVFIGAFAIYMISDNKSKLNEDRLLKEIAKFNRNTPIVVDDFSQFDSVSLSPPRTINYHVTTDKEIVPVDTLKKYFEPTVLSTIKTDKSLKKFRDNDVTFVYLINDRNGDIFHRITITPEMYQSN